MHENQIILHYNFFPYSAHDTVTFPIKSYNSGLFVGHYLSHMPVTFTHCQCCISWLGYSTY